MNKNARNELASAILNVFVPKVENSYIEKVKALANSKSAKNISSVNHKDSAFKKQSNKVQQISIKSIKNKRQTQKISESKQNLLNKSQKIDNLANKIIKNSNSHEKHNPQQFLVRNHLYQKQKQLKLQFERRKKLYGITSDLKFKPELIVKQIQQIKSQEMLKQNEQKSKSYKEMYQKKYGKFKIEDNSMSKKKVKNYEQLMKESIARFQQKFKQLETNQQISQQSTINFNDFESKKLVKFQKDQEKLEYVNEKINILMKKLHIQEDFNVSVQSITDLSKIQMQSNAKHPQQDSSNLFTSIDKEAQIQNVIQEDQEHIFSNLNETQNKQQNRNPFISSFSCILRNDSGPLNQNVHDQSIKNIQNISKSIKETFQQYEQVSINVAQIQKQQNQQKNQEIQIQKDEEAIKVQDDLLNEKSKQSLQYHILKQSQDKQTIIQQKKIKAIEHCQPFYLQGSSQQYQNQTQIQSFIDLNGNFLQDVQVQVQNFGYCRFLAIQEQSERLSQDYYS